MKIHQTIIASAILLASVGVSAANAGVVLSDNFDQDYSTSVLNWPGDAVFTSVSPTNNAPNPASVDLVSNNDGFGNLAYQGGTGGVSVDLDGTTGNGNSPVAGEIQSIQSLATGNYKVSFLLAGNLRTPAEQNTVVSIGGVSQVVTPTSSSQGYAAYNLYFKNVSGLVAFTESGPSDQQGNLLDNVVVTSVPEPATWAMLLLGFFGIGFMMRGARRNDGAVTA